MDSEKNGKVSIILPIYNSEKFLEKTLNSILNQTYTNWELIIVDDCSTDKSENIIDKMKNEKFIVIKNEKNIGPGLGRNKALKIASGKYIAYIDSDDLWKNDKLEKQIEFMKNKEISFCFSSYERIDENTEKINRIVEVPNIIKYKDALKNTIILTSTVIIDVERIDKKLLEMPDLRIGEDTAMFFKVLRNGFDAYGYNEVLTKYRVRKKSLSADKIKSMKQLWKTYKQYEKLGLISRIVNIICYAINATIKRIPKK